jgi:thioredoxin 1
LGTTVSARAGARRVAVLIRREERLLMAVLNGAVTMAIVPGWRETLAIPRLSEADFEREVLASELPVLVDLYADWCAPCKQMEPVLEDLARELKDKLKVVRVDVERNRSLAQAFGVRSIPMLVLIAGGRPVNQLVGAVDKKKLLEFVQPVLPSRPGEMEPKELAALLQARRALAVDIRDSSSYGRFRVPGAANIPAAEIPDRLSELRSRDGRIRVIYSRSEDEARELVSTLLSRGIQVAYLKGGFLNWEAEGLEVERG